MKPTIKQGAEAKTNWFMDQPTGKIVHISESEMEGRSQEVTFHTC